MDGFVSLFARLIEQQGIPGAAIFRKRTIELPGFFRPTKEWDLLVVLDGQLLVALEVKSQVGPSFGNNFNNRTEEAIGTAVDLWAAYKNGAFNRSMRPWLGYMILLEDCDASRSPVDVAELHFQVFPEFRGASYAQRYQIFCQKLVRERHYDAACFIASESSNGMTGQYSEPDTGLSLQQFVASLQGHVHPYGGSRGRS